MKTAIAYVRVSTVEQSTEGVSLAAQEERVRAYCTAAGLALVELIREEGVSATITLGQRPAGRRVIEAIARHKASHVVAMKLDRLFRDAVDALVQTRHWDTQGVALHLVDMGGSSINTATAMGRFFLTNMAGFAELERSLIAERTMLALRHKKARREAYSATPLGFDRATDPADKRLMENAAELTLVAEIQHLRGQGESLHTIARRLNAAGHRGKKGGAFHASTVWKILANPLYKDTR